MMKAIHILNKFKDRMHPPSYDFLLDVPGETDADRIDSLRPFTLILYPGTHLYDLAMAQGIIKDERKEIYNKTYTMRKRDYLNLLFTLATGGNFPSALLRITISPPVTFILNSKIMQPIIGVCFRALRTTYRAAKRLMP